MKIEAKLEAMGYKVPDVPKPVAAYVPAVQTGNLIFTSGQLPMVNGELKAKGQVGGDVAVEAAYEAARACAINCLAVVKSMCGDLDRVKRIVKVVGFVNSAPGFNAQPKVVNGASEFLVEVFGEAGKHARSAVGAAGLPLDACVEVEMVVEIE